MVHVNSDLRPVRDDPAVRETCLCLHPQRAARPTGRRFDKALRPIGLTNGQFSLMMSLNRPEPPQIGSVAALLALNRTTRSGSRVKNDLHASA